MLEACMMSFGRTMWATRLTLRNEGPDAPLEFAECQYPLICGSPRSAAHDRILEERVHRIDPLGALEEAAVAVVAGGHEQRLRLASSLEEPLPMLERHQQVDRAVHDEDRR